MPTMPLLSISLINTLFRTALLVVGKTWVCINSHCFPPLLGMEVKRYCRLRGSVLFFRPRSTTRTVRDEPHLVKTKKPRRALQVAALPIMIGKDGQAYILLVTSRETKRWVIPKGWPSKKLSDPKAAAREASEEAGVTGKVDRKLVGTYTYRKVFPNSPRLVDVVVYPLWVKKQRKNWREKSERARISGDVRRGRPLQQSTRH